MPVKAIQFHNRTSKFYSVASNVCRLGYVNKIYVIKWKWFLAKINEMSQSPPLKKVAKAKQ